MVGIEAKKTIPTLSNYFLFLLGPFFRNWWAVLTGCASIFALYITPSKGINLTGAMMMTMTFIVLAMVFITLAVFSQGWRLYTNQLDELRVSSFERNRDIQDGWVFILSGNIDLEVDTVVDVYKKMGAVEVPLTLVRINARNSNGAYQATPIGRMNPAHIREHSAGGLKPEDLVVRFTVDLHRIKEVFDDLR